MSKTDSGFSDSELSKETNASSAGNTPSEVPSLPYFDSSMYASVLEETITKIRILGECNNELRVWKTLTDIMRLRAIKYQVKLSQVQDPLDGINPKALGKQEYKIEKLANDRKYLYETLLATYIDLSLDRGYSSLAERINEVVDRRRHYDFLLEDESKNRITARELVRNLRQQRNHMKSTNYDTDLVIEELKTKVEDSALTGEVRGRYVSNWEVARTEQKAETIRLKESRALRSLDYYKMKTEQEHRVHSEVELLINIAINEKLNTVESWMNKYDEDLEKIDLKISIRKNEHTNALKERMQLEETFAKHDKLMKEWQLFKEEREKARQYREKMHNAATVVQAWWRGLLVRMKLGPYKPVGGRQKPKKK